MRSNLISKLAVLFGIAVGLLASPALAAEKIKLLIVDGQNNHNWKLMTPVMVKSLEKTGRFQISVATTPPAKSPAEAWKDFNPEFEKYDVVLSNYNGDLWPEAQQRALEKFVASGKGLVIVHAANNSFPGWKEYNDMIGLGWRDNKFGDRVTLNDQGKVVRTPKGEGPGASHGPQHEFSIVVRDREHPVTKGMPGEWMHAKDELYHGQRGPALNMNIIATAFSATDKGGTGSHEPMIWEIPYGKGRVFTTLMGHVMGEETLGVRCVGFQTVVARGCEWVATGKVTLPIPENFPSKNKVSVTE